MTPNQNPESHPLSARMIYFLRAGPYVKIGYTGALSVRLNTLQVGCPYEQKLLATMPGDRTTEATIHFMASRYHYRAEWFYFKGALKRWIEGAQNTVRVSFEDCGPEDDEYWFAEDHDPESQAALAEYLKSVGRPLPAMTETEGIQPPRRPSNH